MHYYKLKEVFELLKKNLEMEGVKIHVLKTKEYLTVPMMERYVKIPGFLKKSMKNQKCKGKVLFNHIFIAGKGLSLRIILYTIAHELGHHIQFLKEIYRIDDMVYGSFAFGNTKDILIVEYEAWKIGYDCLKDRMVGCNCYDWVDVVKGKHVEVHKGEDYIQLANAHYKELKKKKIKEYSSTQLNYNFLFNKKLKTAKRWLM